MTLGGKVVWESLGSVVLKNNPLGDPRLREVPVYLPRPTRSAMKSASR